MARPRPVCRHRHPLWGRLRSARFARLLSAAPTKGAPEEEEQITERFLHSLVISDIDGFFRSVDANVIETSHGNVVIEDYFFDSHKSRDEFVQALLLRMRPDARLRVRLY
jgi:hypothetical protein